MDKAKPGDANSPGAMATVVALLLLSAIGGGGGAILGYTLATPPAVNAPSGAAAAAAITTATDEAGGDAHMGGGNDKHGAGHGDDASKDGHDKDHGDHAGAKSNGVGALQVKELPTIVTNLGQPETSWIRLQAAIVYDPKEIQHAEKLVAELMSDITAFLRNVTLSSLEGSDGLRRLQEDLSERAAIRSDRKVREVIIETMVVQ